RPDLSSHHAGNAAPLACIWMTNSLALIFSMPAGATKLPTSVWAPVLESHTKVFVSAYVGPAGQSSQPRLIPAAIAGPALRASARDSHKVFRIAYTIH